MRSENQLCAYTHVWEALFSTAQSATSCPWPDACSLHEESLKVSLKIHCQPNNTVDGCHLHLCCTEYLRQEMWLEIHNRGSQENRAHEMCRAWVHPGLSVPLALSGSEMYLGAIRRGLGWYCFYVKVTVEMIHLSTWITATEAFFAQPKTQLRGWKKTTSMGMQGRAGLRVGPLAPSCGHHYELYLLNHTSFFQKNFSESIELHCLLQSNTLSNSEL